LLLPIAAGGVVTAQNPSICVGGTWAYDTDECWRIFSAMSAVVCQAEPVPR